MAGEKIIIKADGTNRQVKKIPVKVNGAQREVAKAYVKINGANRITYTNHEHVGDQFHYGGCYQGTQHIYSRSYGHGTIWGSPYLYSKDATHGPEKTTYQGKECYYTQYEMLWAIDCPYCGYTGNGKSITGGSIIEDAATGEVLFDNTENDKPDTIFSSCDNPDVEDITYYWDRNCGYD